ncbi:MAG: type II toxin-antitoxin system VapC family toxin [Blastocatellia bacterium]
MATTIAPDSLKLVLDTDILTDWRYQRSHAMQAVHGYLARFNAFPQLTAMTVFEARFGIENKAVKSGVVDQRLERDRADLERLVQACGVLEIGDKATAIAAYISARLSDRERKKHRADIFIAATALTHGYGVATRNRRDFEMIGQYLPPYAPVLYLAIWKS